MSSMVIDQISLVFVRDRSVCSTFKVINAAGLGILMISLVLDYIDEMNEKNN
jgi:hypothetical protein